MKPESTVTISAQEYADLVQRKTMLQIILRQTGAASYELANTVELVAKCLDHQPESGAADA